MQYPYRLRKFTGPSLVWAGLCMVAIGLFLAYRWAEPSRLPLSPERERGKSVVIRLENAPFTSFSDGRKTWSLRAARLDLERLPGGSLSVIQSAELTDIRNGVLYQLPLTNPSETVPVTGIAEKSRENAPLTGKPETPAATFRAKAGRYALGDLEPVPPEISTNYSVQWQLKLTGDVDLRTREGDRMLAPALTIIEMTHRTTRRIERRIFCEKGAQVFLQDVKMLCNQARYDPANRLVECLGGVRGTFLKGSLQTERLFWSLREESLVCPDTVDGVLRSMPYRAEGLTIDLKHHTLYANHVRARIRMDSIEKEKP